MLLLSTLTLRYSDKSGTGSPMACEPLALLSRLTDVCTSVVRCDGYRGEGASCDSSHPSHPTRIQSLFGSYRRTYAELLQQFPPVRIDLRELRRRPTAVRTLNVVLSRCHEPLLPLLRLLPFMMTVKGWRMRVVVLERCVDARDETRLASLDVRDSSPELRRIALRASPAIAFGQYVKRVASNVVSEMAPEADAVLFIHTALLERLQLRIQPVARTLAAPELATSRDAVKLQDELMLRLKEGWNATYQVCAVSRNRL